MKRAFTSAVGDDRCTKDIKLKDGSFAQCMRRRAIGAFCMQHAKMYGEAFCKFCGGNDEDPMDHCMDCARPTAPVKEG